MENIIFKSMELGTTAFVAVALTYLYTNFRKNNGKSDNTYSKIAAEKVSEIASNHLTHIEAAIKEQSNQSHIDHEKQLGVLIEIRTILSERKL